MCAERDNAVLMVLADGLGGHEGGALAAEILTQTALRAFEAVRQPVITKPSAFLALTIMQAHKAIFARGESARCAPQFGHSDAIARRLGLASTSESGRSGSARNTLDSASESFPAIVSNWRSTR